MPESIINLIKGDKVGDETDYRDALSVNMHTVLRPMFGVQGYMQQSYGLTKYGSVDDAPEPPIPPEPPGFVEPPTNIFPADGALGVDLSNLILQSSAFAVEGEAQSHVSTDWQIADDPAFQTIYWESIDDTQNLTHVIAAGGNPIKQPSNTFPADGQPNIDWQNITVTGSAFDVAFGPVQTHVATDWQFASDAGFTNIIHESLNDSTNLESYDVSNNVPDAAVTYWRHRHFGSLTGASEYSATTSFDTNPTNPILDFNNPNLILAYTMDNINGTTLVDESPNQIDGTITNASQVQGVGGTQAIYFTGTNSFVDFGDIGLFNNEIAVSMWMNSNNWSSATVRFVVCLGLLNFEVQVGGSASNIRVLHGGSFSDVSTAGLINSEFYHFVFSCTATQVRVFIDGVERTVNRIAGGPVASQVGLLGRRDGATPYWMTGAVDQFRIFDRALTQEEVTALYTEFD